MCSDVNKDSRLKADDRTNDWTFRSKARTKKSILKAKSTDWIKGHYHIASKLKQLIHHSYTNNTITDK